jgi:hypothetical protein
MAMRSLSSCVDDALELQFQRILGEPGSRPMDGEYPLDADSLARITEMLGLTLNPESADHFLGRKA